jgi:hypothetical protein
MKEQCVFYGTMHNSNNTLARCMQLYYHLPPTNAEEWNFELVDFQSHLRLAAVRAKFISV